MVSKRRGSRGLVERDAGDDDGLPSLGARRHAVDVVAVADAERRLRGAERNLAHTELYSRVDLSGMESVKFGLQ